MTLEEGVLLAIYLFILCLIAVRFLSRERGRIIRRFKVGRGMTIGDRQVQEDDCGACQSADGFMAVLDDGRGGASVGAVVIKENYLYYALAGNIKIAVYRGGNLVPVSSGHTIDVLAGDKFVEGTITREEALQLLDHTRMYNYVGQDGFREIEFVDTPIRLRERDIVVLMSDGLYEGMDWKTIEELLSGRKKCQQKAYEIIEEINAGSRRERDNASIVLVEGFL